MTRSMPWGSRPPRRRQSGAVAIEFALLFPLFLMIFYAIVSYSIIFMTMQGMQGLSAQAARAVLSVEHGDDGQRDAQEVLAAIDEVIDDHWAGATLCPDRLPDPTASPWTVCLQVEVGLGKALPLPRLGLPGTSLAVPHLEVLRTSSSMRL